ncbi:putative proton-dependent oligopeptide transporter family [Lupinus albus]|uniref:Putative proton-dependent oligopeptide transporter family n=1 Tax=Lupinus albus TaxID=3870 RepID=A0A6A4R6K8_LUPAL|nr:putative proton-dependent oligopeptide transporter family [Lupinus albus]
MYLYLPITQNKTCAFVLLCYFASSKFIIMADIPTSSNVNSVTHRPSSTSTTIRGGWHAAIFIIFVEFAERFAYQGIASNLVLYLTHVMKVPDTIAVKDVNTWFGVSALFPLIGAFIADSYLGRFNTIIISSLIYLLVILYIHCYHYPLV